MKSPGKSSLKKPDNKTTGKLPSLPVTKKLIVKPIFHFRSLKFI